MDEPGRMYAPSYFRVLAAVFLFGCVCGALFTLLLGTTSQSIPGVASFTFLKVLSIVYLWAMICAFVLARFLAVHVSLSGIRARTFWGASKTLGWAAISRAEVTGIPWLGFLCLYPEAGGSPLWVPLFVKNRERFRDDVLSHVDATHPISRALAE